METGRKWISMCYGAAERHQDFHVAFVVISSYLIVRLPQIEQFTWEQFQGDFKTVAIMAIVAILKSYVTNNEPPEGPKNAA